MLEYLALAVLGRQNRDASTSMGHMGLQEAATGKRLNASKIEDSAHVRYAKDNLDRRTLEKICRTIDEAIEEVVSKKTRLVWLNTGSLVGGRAMVPHGDHQHLWEAIYALFPSSTNPVAIKNQRITVGALVKWRVAQRLEYWLVHYRETNKTDIVSGGTIYASEYWIAPAPLVMTAPAKSAKSATKVTVDDLKNKWNQRG